MSVNKQTVWLVTMLSVMVVLSAYYIVTGPVEPARQVAQTAKETDSDVNVNIKPIDEPVSSDKKTEEMLEQANSDFFVGYQLQRSTLRQKMVEEYMQVLTNPKSSEKELEEANQKIQQLMKIDNQETVLEELIRKEGYKDAVVVTNNPHVDVIVQSEKLSKKQVVRLISLVRQHLQVDPQNVSVAYR
ncbi:SpoIIIAH-like family protein [Thermoactinomyces mirandus]|uniref:SpoIIIAH-like family protein n=1 Tax=Thermoactinomyces mirandus TaxID=2756294 RepID=A0A7W2AQV4_9BACL|nr:SpoIIIAH-like family protein [Thermoactinomyces mirandus]MBA4600905.1 SpoIIIAH-like family protein [Thermoactinomyces mirandus]